ncbi:hypothetical protein JGB42_24440, partial [Salmonella enterica subsp. enterica serovar Albany]|nr:hypothetical protein [Salmonella enterica subsp. enterica serovar Albany]
GVTQVTNTNTSTAQLCLAKRRVLAIALTSSAMNAEKSAALAKKGDKIPLTVTVTDGAGTPQPNVPIRLGRGNYSQNRAGGQGGAGAFVAAHRLMAADGWQRGAAQLCPGLCYAFKYGAHCAADADCGGHGETRGD